METSATRGCEHGRACDDYCPECEIDGLSDTIVKLRAEITRLTAELAYAKKGEARLRESAERLRAMITSLTAELAHTDARVRALGAWKIAAIEILFRLHINEAADGQDIDDARELLDREE